MTAPGQRCPGQFRNDVCEGVNDLSRTFGRPYEGFARLARLARLAGTEVATCSFRDRLGDVREQLEASPFGALVALNGDGVGLGRLGRAALAEDDDAPVEALMREGPTTVRPSEELGPLVERMRRGDVDAVLVTRSDGRLLGLLPQPPRTTGGYRDYAEVDVDRLTFVRRAPRLGLSLDEISEILALRPVRGRRLLLPADRPRAPAHPTALTDPTWPSARGDARGLSGSASTSSTVAWRISIRTRPTGVD